MTRCAEGDGPCHLCGDVAVRARVLEVHAESRSATVESGGERAIVATDLVECVVGDVLLVHLGFAIERLDAGERRP